VLNFVGLLLKDGQLALDWNDDLLAKTVWPERATTVAPST
jgi:NAD(P) transhydrogenase subunit alpha